MASLLDTWIKNIKVVDNNDVLDEDIEEEISEGVELESNQDEFTAALIAHINTLYSRILGSEVSEIAGTPTVQTKAWHNPGHSSVTESA
tara:strand:- start:876 stop:1142 length:267 start_codon:yes stop_codon:yes gene_type:complete